MFNKSFIAAAVVAVGASFAAPAMARDNLQIAGSSTVLPFASIVAEEFGNAFPQFKTPVVGSGGSSGGLRQFCQGVGANTIDIANASRPIKSAEVDACKKAGVGKIIEVQIGYDGIVFASRADKGSFALEPRHVFLAAGAQVPQGGKLVANPYTRWSQIDKSLPDQEIVLVIPASNHGTREVFEEKVTHAGCDALPEVKALDGDAKKKVCSSLRQDGRLIEIAGDYTETLARLQAQGDAVGVFGLSFYDQNRDRLKVATVNGVTPSLQTIGSGQYPVSRPLFFYVKGEHIGVIPGLKEYAEYFLSEQVSGFGSPLEAAGLIPLSNDERGKILANVRNGKTVQ
ncbi:substrate-binding domain-containing protein [Pseudothauera rhizosphaerae]|uniref:Phosphonate ABC transporter substrate-binding protein n=1 Tax=Pseudothauera rhizosphaerae TaxID=2565932 RepID=A0A4S4AVH6_9RHOO|nr:substrate-binding domain-containing protein [Pseudothauera rhizosphaerae]THF62546.1 phosphonate ABC transporter substrate-binding protein [Pseudothauera rhizosphaerae]